MPEGYENAKTSIHRLESFRLAYMVAPIFHRPSGIQFNCGGGATPECRRHPMPLLSHYPLWTDQPSLKGHGTRLPDAETQRLLEILRDIHLWPCSTSPLQVNGNSSSLCLEVGLSQIQLSWTGDLPVGWQELQPLLDIVERYMPAPEPF